jgi:hypothetical protein
MLVNAVGRVIVPLATGLWSDRDRPPGALSSPAGRCFAAGGLWRCALGTARLRRCSRSPPPRSHRAQRRQHGPSRARRERFAPPNRRGGGDRRAGGLDIARRRAPGRSPAGRCSRLRGGSLLPVWGRRARGLALPTMAGQRQGPEARAEGIRRSGASLRLPRRGLRLRYPRGPPRQTCAVGRYAAHTPFWVLYSEEVLGDHGVRRRAARRVRGLTGVGMVLGARLGRTASAAAVAGLACWGAPAWWRGGRHPASPSVGRAVRCARSEPAS